MDTEAIPNNSSCTNCSSRCGKLDVYDWLADLPKTGLETNIVEVQFKNTRKGF